MVQGSKGPPGTDALIGFVDLQIDLQRQIVSREGQPLPVQGLSLQLFLYLLSQGTRVLDFDELMGKVWAPAVVNEETVTQRVKLLRQALGDDGRQPRYLRSVRGRGYQLCAQPVTLVPAVPGTPARQAPSWRRPGLLAVLVAVLLGSWWGWQSSHSGSQQQVTAHPLLVRARYYAGIGQRDDNQRAIELYQQLLDLPDAESSDADRRSARLGLSHAYSARVCLHNDGQDWAHRGQALAEAVLTENPDHSGAHAARAYALDCQGRIDSAIAAYERAFALAPDQRDDSRASMAHLLAVRGRLVEALKLNLDLQQRGSQQRFLSLQIARLLELLGFSAAAEQRYQSQFRLFPDNPFINAAYPRFLFNQGRHTEAAQRLAEALARPLHPDLHVLAGELALLRGERVAAHTAFSAAAALKPGSSWPQTLALVYAQPAVSEHTLDARVKLLAAQLSGGDFWPEEYLEIAVLQLARADQPAAIEALQQAVAAGYSDRAYLQTSALFTAMHGDPGFVALLEQIAARLAVERQQAQHLPELTALLAPAPGP